MIEEVPQGQEHPDRDFQGGEEIVARSQIVLDGDLSKDRLLALIGLGRKEEALDCKSSYDLSGRVTKDRVEMVWEVVAMEEYGATKASMLQDLERGIKTEVDVINGAVAEKGREHGVKTPLNARVVELVHAMERGERRPGRDVFDELRELAQSHLERDSRTAFEAKAEARRLLVETDESVENIGTRVGYDDPTYFAHRFREHPRGDPATWRLANRCV